MVVEIRKSLPALLVLLFVCGFWVPSVYALPGSAHVRDMLEVVLEDSSNPQMRRVLAEFTKTIDNFEVVKGLPLGAEGHRLYGHWGFSDAIPFNKPPLRDMLQRIEEKEGRAAAEAAKKKIIESWQRDSRQLIALAEKMLGVGGRSARGLAGLLYSVHLLGDYTGQQLGSLQDVEALTRDIKKNIHRLFGSNSHAAKEICAQLDTVLERAAASCGGSSACRAETILKFMKENKKLQGAVLHLVKARGALGSLFLKPRAQFISQQASLKGMERAAEELGIKGAKAVPGVMLPSGKLLAAVKVGGATGLAGFTFDSGYVYYQYLKGEVNDPECKEKITQAALSGLASSGAASVVVLLGATPAGWIVCGVATGTYIVCDYAQNLYRESEERKILNREDLKVFGIEIDSVLEIKIDKNIVLSPETW